MDLFDLYAKISLDDSEYKKGAESAASASNELRKAVEKLESPYTGVLAKMNTAVNVFQAMRHPIQTVSSAFESLKGKLSPLLHPIQSISDGFKTLKERLSPLAHPIELFKAKLDAASSSAEVQKARLGVLASQYSTAQDKVKALSKALVEEEKKTGSASKETQALAQKLDDAEKEANDAKTKMTMLSQSISDEGEESEESEEKTSKLSTALGALGNAAKAGLATVAKVGLAAISAGIGAAVAGVSALVKSSVEAYGNYEQLVGGVETLFGAGGQSLQEYAQSIGATSKEAENQYNQLISAQNTVMKNAANAFATAGLSANDYMEQVTSFSASLLQGLGGDTQKAAEVADRAIIDMADNANKMGTDMESIQNAYQGFAKQNYTMLDNLKLGYGGTKEEMERLIADAAEMTDVQEKLGVTVDGSSMSFDNIINAISVMQSSMGIAGTTAKEASTTIQGSVNAMKAAWQNVLVGIADDTQDFDTLIENLVESVGTAADNIMPRIETALKGVGKLIQKLAPIISEKIPELVDEVLPNLISAAQELFDGVLAALPGIIQAIVEVAPMIINTLVTAIIEFLPQLMEAAFQIVGFIGTSIIENLPQLIQAALEIIANLATYLAEALPDLIPTIVDIVLEIVETLIDNLDMLIDPALQIIVALAEGIIRALPKLVEKVPILIEKFMQAIVSNQAKIFNTGWDIVVSLVKGVVASIPNLVASIPGLISAYVNGVVATLGNIVNLGKRIVSSIKDGISSAWSSLTSWFNGIWDSLFGKKTVDVSVNKSSTGKSHAIGLDYVPYNNYAANLHRGEMVLTAREAEQYRKGENTANVVQNQYFETSSSDVAKKVDALAETITKYLPQLANMKMVIYPDTVAGVIAPAMNKQLGKIGAREVRVK